MPEPAPVPPVRIYGVAFCPNCESLAEVAIGLGLHYAMRPFGWLVGDDPPADWRTTGLVDDKAEWVAAGSPNTAPFLCMTFPALGTVIGYNHQDAEDALRIYASEHTAQADYMRTGRVFLPYAHQSIDTSDREAVDRVLGSDWLTTGPEVARFEEALAARAGTKHAVAVSSGTAALHLLYLAAGIGADDEIIMSPLTFAATANAALYCGARPVFIDVDDSLNLDPDAVERAITRNTRAIVAVHLAGRICDMDRLLEIAHKHGLLLLEDAAHALGGVWRGWPAGSLGDAAIFSFHPVKHVTTGEGGAIVTDNSELASHVRRLRSHGMGAREGWRYDIAELGYNYRLTDIQCALGTSQLARLDSFLARRREIAATYNAAFGDDPRLRLPTEPEGSEHAWHLYLIRTANRDAIFTALRAENIGVNVHYIPVYRHTIYKNLGYRPDLCPRAEAAYAELLSLPLWPGMTDADAEDVIRAVRKALGCQAEHTTQAKYMRGIVAHLKPPEKEKPDAQPA